MSNSDLRGLRVLIVEDESLIAMLIEDALDELQCSVAAVASTLDDALEKARTLDFDVAILDVNLDGSPAFPVAELLASRGIPFMFSTGYGAGGVSEAFGAPILAKPFRDGEVGRTLQAAMATRAAP